MNLLRLTARVLTGSTYAVLGADAARSPGPRVAQAGPLLGRVRRLIPVPLSDDLVVRGNGAAQAAAGLLLTVGVLPRTSSAVLAATLVPTTLAGHAFWTVEDPALRKMQRVQFQKNLAMIGGLVFAALDRP